jgi:hypothetical protein
LESLKALRAHDPVSVDEECRRSGYTESFGFFQVFIHDRSVQMRIECAPERFNVQLKLFRIVQQVILCKPALVGK